jgi:hypothetical protein
MVLIRDNILMLMGFLVILSNKFRDMKPNGIPYEKSPFLVGKSTINGPFSTAFCMFTGGDMYQQGAAPMAE